ncbi:hypothetical protein M406DRAFT_67868 [Cryphonectria parasitica EP155]|uniref:Uncharacterized protein n=1 Tax=Cryphonectria parasitica (strain ATCC 38755 / EP155) TaxID=660469 RepID=A0A9P5CNG4_CRYP1|nr:uncharacterized protein M406DRAFT_67868 [Cryphonectria parasitica EP155]KAF3765424.1 hypothetical protein M406DRAFT_67868 [Cryphonectria parasitica EP155]
MWFAKIVLAQLGAVLVLSLLKTIISADSLSLSLSLALSQKPAPVSQDETGINWPSSLNTTTLPPLAMVDNLSSRASPPPLRLDCRDNPNMERDPRWHPETLDKVSCEYCKGLSWGCGLWSHWKVVLPNDHLFDEQFWNHKDPSLRKQACGRSLWILNAAQGKRSGACQMDDQGTATIKFQTVSIVLGEAVEEAVSLSTCGLIQTECMMVRGIPY